MIFLQLLSRLFVPLFQDLSIEEQSECTQDFYQNVAERMQTRGKGNTLLACLWGIAGSCIGPTAESLSSFPLSQKAWLVCLLCSVNYSTDIQVAGVILNSVFEYHHVYHSKIIKQLDNFLSNV